MLHSPVNAYPHNATVDVNYPIPFTFTHHGSALTHCHYQIFKTEDASSVTDWWVDYAQSVYNGDDVSSVLLAPDVLQNGNNYKWNATQYIDNANIYASRGSVLPKEFIQTAYEKNTTAFQEGFPEGVTITDVEQLIPVAFETVGIEAPTYVNGEFIGGQYLEINGERRLILGYWESYPMYLLYKETYSSAIIVDKPFSTFPTTIPTQTWRCPYRIFKNYLSSPYFYMKARALPVVEANAEYTNGVLHCSATYTQENASLVESYQWKIYDTMSNTSPANVGQVQIATSERIQTLTSLGVLIDASHIPLDPASVTVALQGKTIYYLGQHVVVQSYDANTGIATLTKALSTFPQFEDKCTVYAYSTQNLCMGDVAYSERLSNEFWLAPFDTMLMAVLRVQTTDGAWIERTLTVNPIALPEASSFSSCQALITSTSSECYSTITWQLRATAVFVNIYKSVDGGRFEPLAQGVDAHGDGYRDYMIGREHFYRYMILPTNTSGDPMGGAGFTETVQPNYKGWLITALQTTDTFCDRTIYTHGETWNLNIELSDTDVTHNTNRAYFMGGGRFPKQYRTLQRYVNGSLSSVLGAMDCETRTFAGDIRKLDAWRQFIFDNQLFLLRSSKGDCWLVTIDANPTESYPTQLWGKTIPVTVKIDYTEVCDSSKAIVR